MGLVHAIEGHSHITMQELEMDDTRVAEIMVQVNTVRREADIQLGENDWGAAKETNKRKKLILEGKDPEAVEKLKKKLLKKKRKREKKENASRVNLETS